MRLFVRLVLRMVAVAIACLACAIVWVVADAQRAIERDTEATAERVGQQLAALYWRELLWRGGAMREPLLPTPEWRTLETATLISPGICVDFRFAREESRRLCGQVAGVGAAAPSWFGPAYRWILGPNDAVARPLSDRQHEAGSILVAPQPEAAVRLAWERMRALAGLALALAGAMSLLSALAIAQALAPARKIISGLERLARGDYRSRVADVQTREFAPIGAAVNALGDQLSQATAERIALTRRLLEAREEERLDLSRELHDEFGQCLTAAAAFAGAIEAGAEENQPEIAADAREIQRLMGRMSSALRGALKRLRNPVADEAGLEASLIELVAGCKVSGARAVSVSLQVEGDLATVPQRVAAHIYRIAQECLTNAFRHGGGQEVHLKVERTDDRGDAIVLTVEDDGGGDASRVAAAKGRGIAGIRERISAFGGELQILSGARGVRVAAFIPLTPSA
jgi:signal transduction histidine kinase